MNSAAFQGSSNSFPGTCGQTNAALRALMPDALYRLLFSKFVQGLI
jgi:hypothetical protein